MNIWDFLRSAARIKELLLFLIVIAIPLKVNMGNITLILAAFYNLVFFDKTNFRKLKSFPALFLLAFFLISMISTLMSKDFHAGLVQLNKHLLLLLMVPILINIKIDRDLINRLFRVFFVSVLFVTVILLGYALLRLFAGNPLETVAFHGFTSLFDQHPVYFALYLSLAMCFGIHQLLKGQGTTRRIYVLAMAGLLAGLVFCASKAVLFIDFVLITGFFIYRMKKAKAKIIFGLGMVLLMFGMLKIPFVYDRFLSGLRFNPQILAFEPSIYFGEKKTFTLDQKESISDLELRYLFLKIGLYHFMEDQRILFGYGQGDLQDYLDYHLFTYNLGPNWYEGFNVHNQFLQILLYYGLFVFLFFGYYLFYSIQSAIINRDYLYLFFAVTTCFVFIFEVLLQRNKGLVFFYFFNTLFLLNTHQFENSNPRHKGNSK